MKITNRSVENLYKNIKGNISKRQQVYYLKNKGLNIHNHLEFLKYERKKKQSLFHRAKPFYSITKLYN